MAHDDMFRTIDMSLLTEQPNIRIHNCLYSSGQKRNETEQESQTAK